MSFGWLSFNDREVSTGIYIYRCTLSGVRSVVQEHTTGGFRVPAYTPLSNVGVGLPNASIYWTWLEVCDWVGSCSL